MRAAHERVDVPASSLKENVLRVLHEEGYLASYRRVGGKGRTLRGVGLRYGQEGGPVVSGLERISRPGGRVYKTAKEIPEVLGGLGTSIISTSKGSRADAKPGRHTWAAR